MLSQHCYRELDFDTSLLVPWLLNEIEHRETWHTYFGFQAFPLDVNTVLDLCPPLQTVNSIAEIMSFGITKMLEYDYYQLHTDNVRGATINMLLSDENSVCAFVDEQNKKTIQLDYQLSKMYLFNTQVPHTVLNFQGTRILFSTEFKQPKELLPYRQLVKMFSKVQLL